MITVEGKYYMEVDGALKLFQDGYDDGGKAGNSTGERMSQDSGVLLGGDLVADPAQLKVWEREDAKKDEVAKSRHIRQPREDFLG